MYSDIVGPEIEGASHASMPNPARKNVSKSRGRRPIDLEKRRTAILRRVTPLFLEQGYDNVSVNDVVDRVGGSKTTIYSLFGDKEGLLDAIVRHVTSEVALGIDVSSSGTLEEQLTRIGRSFLTLVLSPRVLAFHRLMVSIGRKFPKAGRAFFEFGPVKATAIMASWIAEQQKAGHLIEGDPQRLAQLFHDMLVGEHQLGWLTSYQGATDPGRVEATVKLAARIFLNGCATRRTAR